MIKHDVLNYWTGAVQFTAEIKCAADALPSVKLGLAVKWGYANGASLVGARLDGASLDGARLVGARLVGASLDGASLDGARLDGARLDGARLVGASLDGASLDGARLDGAILNGRKIKDAVTLGYPNSWGALTYLTAEGEQRIIVGCRDKTIAEGRAYWAGKDDRREVLAVLDYAEAIARARGWISAVAEAA